MDDSESPLPAPQRKIIHVDMDAFFASVEQRDNPDLRGLPVAVGGSKARGVVAAASYEARRYGVRSAMPSVTALRKCPELIFVKGRFDAYREVSAQIRAIFADYADEVEPLSLDEAYLDVTSDRAGLGTATAIAEAIRARIKAETRLTASAGVSYCKFIAKMASDQNKPDGICVIPPHKGPAFVASLPIGRFHGVGPKTAARMNALGIYTGADLAAKDQAFLARHFGSSAEYYWRISRGIDDRAVKSNRIRKSYGTERTFDCDLSTQAELTEALDRIIAINWEGAVARGVRGRTVVLKVKYADFRQITRSHSLPHPVPDGATFAASAHRLLAQLLPVEKGIRLLGVTLAGLVHGERLADQPEATEPSLPLLFGDEAEQSARSAAV